MVMCLRFCWLQDVTLEDFTYRLSESDVSEIIAATDAILAKGVKVEEEIRKVSTHC